MSLEWRSTLENWDLSKMIHNDFVLTNWGEVSIAYNKDTHNFASQTNLKYWETWNINKDSCILNWNTEEMEQASSFFYEAKGMFKVSSC
jgi:hypothetical protein